MKALALVRSQKVEESLVLCDEILESKPTNEAVLTAMMHVLRGLGRRTHPVLFTFFGSMTLPIDTDLVIMFDEAFKKQPLNEDLGMQTFFANVRAGNWKSAHQVCQNLNFNNPFRARFYQGGYSYVQAISRGAISLLECYQCGFAGAVFSTVCLSTEWLSRRKTLLLPMLCVPSS